MLNENIDMEQLKKRIKKEIEELEEELELCFSSEDYAATISEINAYKQVLEWMEDIYE